MAIGNVHASECNGDPLFLAVYRELTHRHWHALNSRPNLSDRIEGWNVYRELFDEILETSASSSFLLAPRVPVWVFEILHEFVYQFQRFCQIRTAVYAAACKHGLLPEPQDNESSSAAAPVSSNKHSNLQENLILLQINKDAWDTEAVFSYLHRLIQLGMPSTADSSSTQVPAVYSYFALFGSIALSRLECLLGDFTASLQAKRERCDAITVTARIKSNCLANSTITFSVCSPFCNKSVPPTVRTWSVREKHGSKIETATSYEEWFQSPKFIAADPASWTIHRQQVDIFNQQLKAITPAGKNLRSYLKLYTSLPGPTGQISRFGIAARIHPPLIIVQDAHASNGTQRLGCFVCRWPVQDGLGYSLLPGKRYGTRR